MLKEVGMKTLLARGLEGTVDEEILLILTLLKLRL